MHAELRGIFANNEGMVRALDRHAAQEAENERCFEQEQNLFITQTLPQMIAEFSAELLLLNDQQWEKTSFEKAVKVLTKVEQKWDELKGKGLQALFKTNFLYHFNRGIGEPLITRLAGADAFKILMSGNSAQIESEKLTTLFNRYQPEAGNEGISVEEKTKALAFLIFARETFMNQ